MDDILRFVRDGVTREKGRWPELSKVSGVSYSWITKFGSGRYKQHPNLRTLEKLATALGRPGQ